MVVVFRVDHLHARLALQGVVLHRLRAGAARRGTLLKEVGHITHLTRKERKRERLSKVNKSIAFKM